VFVGIIKIDICYDNINIIDELFSASI